MIKFKGEKGGALELETFEHIFISMCIHACFIFIVLSIGFNLVF